MVINLKRYIFHSIFSIFSNAFTEILTNINIHIYFRSFIEGINLFWLQKVAWHVGKAGTAGH